MTTATVTVTVVIDDGEIVTPAIPGGVAHHPCLSCGGRGWWGVGIGRSETCQSCAGSGRQTSRSAWEGGEWVWEQD